MQIFKEYLKKGDFLQDFENRPPDGQAEMLDIIDEIFEICEIADEIISQHFYKKWGTEIFKK